MLSPKNFHICKKGGINEKLQKNDLDQKRPEKKMGTPQRVPIDN
jgi:hypothetical protein